jgi:hypothetical protein
VCVTPGDVLPAFYLQVVRNLIYIFNVHKL